MCYYCSKMHVLLLHNNIWSNTYGEYLKSHSSAAPSLPLIIVCSLRFLQQDHQAPLVLRAPQDHLAPLVLWAPLVPLARPAPQDHLEPSDLSNTHAGASRLRDIMNWSDQTLAIVVGYYALVVVHTLMNNVLHSYMNV